MKEAGYTRQERKFIASMRLFGLLFLGTALLIMAMPDMIISYVTRIGVGIFSWKVPLPPSGVESFWAIPTGSLLFASAYISFLVSRNPLEYILFTRIIILSKLISTVGFAILFFRTSYFVALVACGVDGMILLIIWLSYWGAHSSRNR